MTRIQRIDRKTGSMYFVYLPSSQVKENQLKKGDIVDVQITDKDIEVTKQ